LIDDGGRDQAGPADNENFHDDSLLRTLIKTSILRQFSPPRTLGPHPILIGNVRHVDFLAIRCSWRPWRLGGEIGFVRDSKYLRMGHCKGKGALCFIPGEDKTAFMDRADHGKSFQQKSRQASSA
jgi:hypothetical protein